MARQSRHEAERADVLDLIETEGIRAAAQAAIDVCKDKSAAAPARATAAGLLMRAAALGGFGKNYEPAVHKEPHEMSGEELAAAVDEMRADLARRRRAAEDDGMAFD